MTSKYLPADTILTILKETPLRLESLTERVAVAALHAAPSADEWSVNDVLAHLRACADVWGDYYIATILEQDQPTIKAMNPRTWIKTTDYLEQEFPSSLRAFSKQRRKLLKTLETLSAQDWARTNTLIGAGKPLTQTLLSHADGLARHERAHLRQVERILAKSKGDS